MLDFAAEIGCDKTVDVNHDTHEWQGAEAEKEHVKNAVSNALHGDGAKKCDVNHAAGQETVE